LAKDNSWIKHQIWVNPLMIAILGTLRFVISPFLGWSDLINNVVFAIWMVGLILVNYFLYLNWKKNHKNYPALRNP
jgi:hypothetical protein